MRTPWPLCQNSGYWWKKEHWDIRHHGAIKGVSKNPVIILKFEAVCDKVLQVVPQFVRSTYCRSGMCFITKVNTSLNDFQFTLAATALQSTLSQEKKKVYLGYRCAMQQNTHEPFHAVNMNDQRSCTLHKFCRHVMCRGGRGWGGTLFRIVLCPRIPEKAT